MQQLLVEQRGLLNRALTWDLAHHLYTRQFQGVIVVVNDRPAVLLATLSKQWQKVLREVQRERASTLRASRIRELTYELMHMQRLRMTIELPAGTDATVHIVTAEQILREPPICQTIYFTCNIDKASIDKLTQNMPDRALIVRY